MHLLTYTPPDRRLSLGMFPQVVPPPPVIPVVYPRFDGTLAELLRLRPCYNCQRQDRLTLKHFRREYHIACDCGTTGPVALWLIGAVNWWNGAVQFTASGQLVASDGQVITGEDHP